MSMFRQVLIDKALNSGGDNPYLNMPITLLTLEVGNTITLKKQGSPTAITCFYKINNGSWIAYTVGTGISLPNIGDKVSFKCSTTTFSKASDKYYYFSSTKNFNAYGNVMSLVQGNRTLTSLTTILHNYLFNHLFYYCTKLINVLNLQLPATTLADYCYSYMFSLCENLLWDGSSCLKLPATTLAYGCYSNMFFNCGMLYIPPELPATTLANQCYNSMFCLCLGLGVPPELPATTLAYGCYQSMFNGCTSLNVAPELPATILADHCYTGMFSECYNLVEAPVLPATILMFNCYLDMFTDCPITDIYIPNLSKSTFILNADSSCKFISTMFDLETKTIHCSDETFDYTWEAEIL